MRSSTVTSAMRRRDSTIAPASGSSSISRQAGAMVRPLGAMANTVVPPSAAPAALLTPSGGPTTVNCPPVGKAGLPASVSVTEWFPGQ
jgi:hypothetical protein